MGDEHQRLDRPEGVAFQKVKSFGPAAYPKLISMIDDEDTAIGTAAVLSGGSAGALAKSSS